MTRALSFTGWVIMITLLFSSSCKKDEIAPGNIEKVELSTGSRINRIQFINDSVFIACGGERFHTAEIITSRDAGMSWAVNSYPDAGKGLYGMARSANGTVYLCGVDGKLMVSKDNGSTWIFHQLGYWWYYNSLAFTANGGCILVSTKAQNYGTLVHIDSNYNITDTIFMKFGLNDIAMPTEQTGYIAGFGAVLKTTNGGHDWKFLDIKNDNFISMHCLTENELWVCGYRGSIFHTTDGGQSWDKQRNGNSLTQKSYLLLDIFFKDKTHGWACGENGLLIYTTDGGNKWKEYKKFTDNALRSMTMAPDGKLLLCGDNGTLYKIDVRQ